MTEFLRNVWYMAGWGEEVGDKLLARTLVETPIVLYRREDGSVAALQDMCPHRFAPLSMGRRYGDVIECAYHGLRFDSAGACVLNPYGDKAPAAAHVATYPVVERYGAVWIWFGEAQADPALIPDLSFMDAPGSRTVRQTAHMNADYQLGTDNLLDLSHIQFLHPNTFGNEAIAGGEHVVRQEGRVLHSNRWSPNGQPPAGMARMMPDDGKPVDLWHDMRWEAPATMALDLGLTPSGRPREEGARFMIAHVLTPETAQSCHYFLGSTRWSAIDSPEVDQATIAINEISIEGEDKPMVEAVQRRMAGRDLFEMKPVLLPGDAGAVRARRMLREMIAAERRA